MNIGNYHLYADIDDVERKFVIGKKKKIRILSRLALRIFQMAS